MPKIYVNKEEMTVEELQGIDNLVPVEFTDGAYYYFPESQKIQDGIYFIKAKGYTHGNSIVIVELGGLFYMIYGDIIYVDEALYENKLLLFTAVFSRIFEEKLGNTIFLEHFKELFKQTLGLLKNYECLCCQRHEVVLNALEVRCIRL